MLLRGLFGQFVRFYYHERTFKTEEEDDSMSEQLKALVAGMFTLS